MNASTPPFKVSVLFVSLSRFGNLFNQAYLPSYINASEIGTDLVFNFTIYPVDRKYNAVINNQKAPRPSLPRLIEITLIQNVEFHYTTFPSALVPRMCLFPFDAKEAGFALAYIMLLVLPHFYLFSCCQ